MRESERERERDTLSHTRRRREGRGEGGRERERRSKALRCGLWLNARSESQSLASSLLDWETTLVSLWVLVDTLCSVNESLGLRSGSAFDVLVVVSIIL